MGCRSVRYGRPPTKAEPASGASRPRITRIVVDLPAPLGPTKPVTCPGATVNDMPSSATVGPNRLRSPLTSIVVSMSWLYGNGANTARTVPVSSLLDLTRHPGGGRLSEEMRKVPTKRPPRRFLPRRTVRLRLTALYGVMFLFSGAVVLGIASGVVVSRSTATAVRSGGQAVPAPQPALARADARIQQLQQELAGG